MAGHRFALRLAVAADAAAISDVLADAYAGLRPYYEPAVLEAALPAISTANPALLASGQYHVQEVPGGRIVSCGGWTREAPGTGLIEDGVAHVRHFATHSGWTRHGLGAGIFARCRQDALVDGVRMFRCYATLGAEAFYLSLGFRTVERMEVALRGGVKFPSIAMVWEGPPQQAT